MTLMKTMTKAQELLALDTFLESLPQASYLRPALEAYRPMVERDIENDLMPNLGVYRRGLVDTKEEYELVRKQVAKLEAEVRELERKKRSLARDMASVADSVESAAMEFVGLVKRLKDAEKCME